MNYLDNYYDTTPENTQGIDALIEDEEYYIQKEDADGDFFNEVEGWSALDEGREARCRTDETWFNY